MMAMPAEAGSSGMEMPPPVPAARADAGSGCPVCGASPVASRCARCGHPEVPEAAARALAESVELLAAGALDAAIRRCRQAVADAPDSWIPRLRLAAAFERKAQEGEVGLFRIADRELAEAGRLAPGEREVHLARVALGAKTGRLPFLRAEFTHRRDELGCAAEMLRIIDSLEQAGGMAPEVAAVTGASALRSRYMFMGAVGLGLAGGLQMSAIIHAALNNPEYDLTGQGGFWVSVALITGAGGLALEGWRVYREGRQP